MGLYWRGDGITLWHGDCRHHTDWLEADVLVTDPPYGRVWAQGLLARTVRAGDNSHAGIEGDTDTTVRDAALTLWGERAAVVFGDLTLPPPAGIRQTLVYRKPPNAGVRGATGGYRRDLEALYLLGQWPTGIGGRSSLLTTGARSQSNPSGLTGRYGHPHAKPVDLLEQLLTTCPPGVVADPFAGSGSTLLAARAQGRRAVGVELDERYCEVIARRLSQGDLFAGAELAE